ncbi:MAG: CinA family protein [Chloroflexi bacterium]|nr:CinA family protein [Chloroflexota bacterium]
MHTVLSYARGNHPVSAPTIGRLHRRTATCLTTRHETLACVEIGSGGQVSRCLTSEPGSSAFFAGSLIFPADAALWPQAITGDGSWRAAPPSSHTRLAGLAGVAQAAFGTDWGLAVECLPANKQTSLSLALLFPDGNAVSDTVFLAEDAAQTGEERLVQCVLGLLAQRLEEHNEKSP